MRSSRQRTSSTHYYISCRCLHKIPSGAHIPSGGVDIDETSDSEVRIWDIICLDSRRDITPTWCDVMTHYNWRPHDPQFIDMIQRVGILNRCALLAFRLQMMSKKNIFLGYVTMDDRHSTIYLNYLIFSFILKYVLYPCFDIYFVIHTERPRPYSIYKPYIIIRLYDTNTWNAMVVWNQKVSEKGSAWRLTRWLRCGVWRDQRYMYLRSESSLDKTTRDTQLIYQSLW